MDGIRVARKNMISIFGPPKFPIKQIANQLIQVKMLNDSVRIFPL